MSTPKTKAQVMEEVERALDMTREGLALHRGGVELVDVDLEAGVATVRLQGTCVGCPLSGMTLKSGIEEAVRMMVPEITEVVNIEPAHAEH
ncbi:MAG: hypothetical protein RL141_268 [Candidatus Parcubacteria bacterium]|jgi:Fe-S cluster biogenesis protein NfuA